MTLILYNTNTANKLWRKIALQRLHKNESESAKLNLKKALARGWTKAYARPLSECELKEISDSLFCFFSLLKTWQDKEVNRDDKDN